MSFPTVVVTGFGTVNPLAHNVNDTWRVLLEGRSGIGPITSYSLDEFPTYPLLNFLTIVFPVG